MIFHVVGEHVFRCPHMFVAVKVGVEVKKFDV